MRGLLLTCAIAAVLAAAGFVLRTGAREGTRRHVLGRNLMVFALAMAVSGAVGRLVPW